MCSISVLPMPSTMSTPKCALEALADVGRQRLAGRRARRRRPRRARAGRVRQHAGKAGGRAVEHRGLEPPTSPRQRLKVASGVGRSAISSVVAPTLIGKVSALPRP
jgi:hypothetical protein